MNKNQCVTSKDNKVPVETNISAPQIQEKPHHIQLELCTTRLPYRQGRKLTAVKVYTVNNESQHILIVGVPKLNLRSELMRLCSKYGNISKLYTVADYPNEDFTECFHVVYEKIQSARIAKRLIDAKNFYGGILHLCYGPELESLEETRQKLDQRRREVNFRILKNRRDGDIVSTSSLKTDENLFEDVRDSILNKNKPENSKKRKHNR